MHSETSQVDTAAEIILGLLNAIGRLLEENTELRRAAEAALEAWEKMPDGGLAAGDPRYAWWWSTISVRDELRKALKARAV